MGVLDNARTDSRPIASKIRPAPDRFAAVAPSSQTYLASVNKLSRDINKCVTG